MVKGMSQGLQPPEVIWQCKGKPQKKKKKWAQKNERIGKKENIDIHGYETSDPHIKALGIFLSSSFTIEYSNMYNF